MAQRTEEHHSKCEKIMVMVDVTCCTYTKFNGRGLSGLKDNAIFKTAKWSKYAIKYRIGSQNICK